MPRIYLKDQLQVARVMSVASLMYDYLYDKATMLFNEYNPCAVRYGTCVSGRGGGNEFCCFGCDYLGDNGCTTRALSCKLYLCNYCIRPKEFMDKFDDIMRMCRGGWSEGLLWINEINSQRYSPRLDGYIRASKEEEMLLLHKMLLKYHMVSTDMRPYPEGDDHWTTHIITNKPKIAYVLKYSSEKHLNYYETKPPFIYAYEDFTGIRKKYLYDY